MQGAEQPAMSWHARYRRLPCGRADRKYLQVCRPSPFVDRRITGRLEDGGERLILEVSRVV